MDMTEFDYNMASGEFADKTITLVYGNLYYPPIPAIVSKKYARKEVDGRFTTDLPTYSISVTVADSNIPSDIPRTDLDLLVIVIDDESYAVRYVTGTGLYTFTLKPTDDSHSESEEIPDEYDNVESEEDEEEV